MPEFKKDLTSGNVFKQLLGFSVPFLLANLLQALYSVVDMIVVGQYVGPIGVSSVQVGSQVMQLIINMVSGLGVGATVMVAQYQGAGKNDDQKRTIGTLFTVFFIISVVVTAIMTVFNSQILHLLGADGEVFDDAASYMLICSAGSIFTFGYNAVSGILRGMGDSVRPLVFVGIAAGCNIVLDVVFVGVLGLRAAGAAWATVISIALSFVLSVIYLRKKSFVFDFKPSSFKIDREKLRLILRIGLPTSVQFSITGFSFLILTGLSNSILPVVGSSVLGIASKLNTFGILACIAMSSSISSMSAQNIGAGKFDRAKKTMWCGMGMAFAVSVAVFAIINLFPNAIINLFMSPNGLSGDELSLYEQCMSIGPTYLRLASFDYLIACVFFCTNGLATGSGHTFFSLINSAVNSLAVRVPLAYILAYSFGMGVNGVAAALGFAPIISAVVGLIYVNTNRWKKPVMHLGDNLNESNGVAEKTSAEKQQ